MNFRKPITGFLLIITSIIIVSCGGSTRDQDSNILKMLKIGNQIWMAENLIVSHFRNGDLIPEARSSEEWIRMGYEGKPAWCTEQNDPDNKNKQGKLYNWYAVNDPRGLAPKGWHVSSDEEWTQITDFLGGEVLAAMNLRTNGSTKKSSENIGSGFSGIPAGGRNNTGEFYGNGSLAMWWTATEVNESDAWLRLLNYVQCNIYTLYYNKVYGFSVRCIRD